MGFSFSVYLHSLTSAYLLRGAFVTAWLTVAAMAGGIALALPLALASISGNRILWAPARLYVWLFRGTPLLVQLVAWYTGLPQVGIRLPAIEAAVVGLALNEAAYMAEILRAGLLSVDRGQLEAARALGMRPSLTLRRIVFPQAVRIALPPTGNEIIGMLKNTSLVSTIAVGELFLRTENVISTTFMTLELLAVASTYYLAMTTLVSALQRIAERRSQRHQTSAGKTSKGTAGALDMASSAMTLMAGVKEHT